MNFNLLPNTSSSLSASWEVPARPNGIILGYTISCTTPSITAMPITVIVPGSVQSHLLMGLEPFTNYTCEVRANTSAGVGDSSNADTERTDEDGKDFFLKLREILEFTQKWRQSSKYFLFVLVVLMERYILSRKKFNNQQDAR